MLLPIPQWVAVYTNPRSEKKTERNLIEAGFETYLPLRRELHSWSDRKKWVEAPLIKSYVFVRITNKQEVPLRTVPGVSHLVNFRGDVATIPEWDIQMMKDFLATEVAVQIRDSEMLVRGARVRITEGALAGKEGILISDCEDGNFAVEITGISMAMIIHVDHDFMEILPDDDDENGNEKNTKRKEYHF